MASSRPTPIRGTSGNIGRSLLRQALHGSSSAASPASSPESTVSPAIKDALLGWGKDHKQTPIGYWRHAALVGRSAVDPWSDHHLEKEVTEVAIEHLYDPATRTWNTRPVFVKTQPEPFAHGAARQCMRLKKLNNDEESGLSLIMGGEEYWHNVEHLPLHEALTGVGRATCGRFCRKAGIGHSAREVVLALRDRPGLWQILSDEVHGSEALRDSVFHQLEELIDASEADERKWRSAKNFVMKEYMEASEDALLMQRTDVEMQMVAKHYSELYNLTNPPKPVDVLQASLLHFPERPGQPTYALEAHIPGKYVKWNSNSGYVSEVERRTPQCFSHFTFVVSEAAEMVVDIQGVDDIYTDPQIHTISGEEYGSGNLGASGMARFFASHVCSPLCNWLGLPEFDLRAHEAAYAAALDASQSASTVDKTHPLGPLPSPLSDDSPLPDSPSLAYSLTLPPDGLSLARQTTELFGSAAASMPFGSSDTRTSAGAGGAPKGALDRVKRSELAPSSGAGGRSDSPDHLSPVHADRAVLERSLRRSMKLVRREMDNTWNPASGSPSKIDRAIGAIHAALAKHHGAGEYTDRVPNFGACLYHLRKAGERGHSDAVLALKNAFRGQPNDMVPDVEDHVESDADEARRWLIIAATIGDRSSMIELADELADSPTRDAALQARWLERAIDAGADVPDSARGPLDTKTFLLHAKLGELYMTGGPGLEVDYALAAEHYEAAQEGAMAHPSGQRKFMEYMSKADEARSLAEA